MVKVSAPTVNMNQCLSEIRDGFLDPDVHNIPVLDDQGNIFGVATSTLLAEQLTSDDNPKDVYLREVCSRKFTAVHPDTLVTEAIARIKETDYTFIVVAENERYIGLVTAASLLDMIHVTSEGGKSADAVIDPKTQSNG